MAYARFSYDEHGRIIESESVGVPPPWVHIDGWYRTVESLWIQRDDSCFEVGVRFLNPQDDRIACIFTGVTSVESCDDRLPTAAIRTNHDGGLAVETLPFGFRADCRECALRAAGPMRDLPAVTVKEPFAHADGDELTGTLERLEIRNEASPRLVIWLTGHPPIVCDEVSLPFDARIYADDDDPFVLRIHDRRRVNGWEVAYEIAGERGFSIQCESVGVADPHTAGDKLRTART